MTLTQAAFRNVREVRMSPSARLVLIATSFHTDQNPEAPMLSNPALQAMTRLSERGVRKALRELEGLGLIGERSA